jgi:hypothetical protein
MRQSFIDSDLLYRGALSGRLDCTLYLILDRFHCISKCLFTASSSTLVNHDTDFSSPPTPTNGPHFSSFKKQMEFLLTSRERMQLKKALQIYSRNRYSQSFSFLFELISRFSFYFARGVVN